MFHDHPHGDRAGHSEHDHPHGDDPESVRGPTTGGIHGHELPPPKTERPVTTGQPLPLVQEAPLGPPKYVTQQAEAFALIDCRRCVGVERPVRHGAPCDRCDGLGVVGVPLKRVRFYQPDIP